jgi:hypothetical protein
MIGDRPFPGLRGAAREGFGLIAAQCFIALTRDSVCVISPSRLNAPE